MLSLKELKKLENHRHILAEINKLNLNESDKCSFDYFILASDCADAVEDHELALQYSIKMCSLEPNKPNGYWRQARSNLKLGRYEKATAICDIGITRCGFNFYLLSFGYRAYRSLGNKQMTCEYARLIVNNYPDKSQGYIWEAEVLISLNSIDEATICLSNGLLRFQYDDKFLYKAYELFRSMGDRQKCVEISKTVIDNNGTSNWDWISRLIINLVILGRMDEARDLVTEASGFFVDEMKPNLLLKLDRFLKAEDLQEKVEDVIFATRRSLHDVFDHLSSSLPLHELLGHSDYILVANNSNLKFCEHDCEIVKNMKNPLFVYCNIGNPTFCASRNTFWHDHCKELLYGRTQHMASEEGQLFFKPYDLKRFQGCFFVKEGVAPPWLKDFSQINECAKAYMIDDVNKIIQSCYPLTEFYWAKTGKMRRRVPSMGWYVVTLFEALATYQLDLHSCSQQLGSNERIKVWTAGFTLSPSYMFETGGGELHDHVFEKAAIDYRIKNELTSCIGRTDGLAKELHQKELVGDFRLWKNK